MRSHTTFSKHSSMDDGRSHEVGQRKSRQIPPAKVTRAAIRPVPLQGEVATENDDGNSHDLDSDSYGIGCAPTLFTYAFCPAPSHNNSGHVASIWRNSGIGANQFKAPRRLHLVAAM